MAALLRKEGARPRAAIGQAACRSRRRREAPMAVCPGGPGLSPEAGPAPQRAPHGALGAAPAPSFLPPPAERAEADPKLRRQYGNQGLLFIWWHLTLFSNRIVTVVRWFRNTDHKKACYRNKEFLWDTRVQHHRQLQKKYLGTLSAQHSVKQNKTKANHQKTFKDKKTLRTGLRLLFASDLPPGSILEIFSLNRMELEGLNKSVWETLQCRCCGFPFPRWWGLRVFCFLFTPLFTLQMSCYRITTRLKPACKWKKKGMSSPLSLLSREL